VKNLIKLIISIFYFVFLKLFKKKREFFSIYYHDVKSFEKNAFEKQMKYLKDNFSPISIDEIDENRFNTVLVTFDDAFLNIIENAISVLEKYNIPALIFVPTGSINMNPEWLKNLDHPDSHSRVMSEKELKSINKDLFLFGSHSVSHSNFATIDSEEAKMQLSNSKRTLENILKYKINSFSFPHGAYDDAKVDLAIKKNYKYIFGIKPTKLKKIKNSLVIGRLKVDPDISFLEFKLKLNGGYNWTAFLG